MDAFKAVAGRGITLLLEAYDGPAPFGQYFGHNISYYRVGVQFDL